MASRNLVEHGGSVLQDIAFLGAAHVQRNPETTDTLALRLEQRSRTVSVHLTMIVQGSAVEAEELAEELREAARRRGHDLQGDIAIDRTGLAPSQQAINLMCAVKLPKAIRS